MSNMGASPVLQPGYVVFNNLIQYKPTTPSGGLFTTYPQVVYNNVVYQYNDYGTPVFPATNPVTYQTPDVDLNTVALYALGGTNNSYAQIANITNNNANVTAAAVDLTGNVTQKSADITLTATAINLPISKTFKVKAVFNITSSLASGATFTITGTSATVTASQPAIVPASITGGSYTVTAIVTTASSGTPSISITASAVTGTVKINSGTVQIYV